VIVDGGGVFPPHTEEGQTRRLMVGPSWVLTKRLGDVVDENKCKTNRERDDEESSVEKLERLASKRR